MIPTDTDFGRLAVQILHTVVGLRVQFFSKLFKCWCFTDAPGWMWSEGFQYRIHPDDLREWMGSGSWVYMDRWGGVNIAGSVWIDSDFDSERYPAYWHRSEILDEPPQQSVEELKRLARLGLGERSKGPIMLPFEDLVKSFEEDWSRFNPRENPDD